MWIGYNSGQGFPSPSLPDGDVHAYGPLSLILPLAFIVSWIFFFESYNVPQYGVDPISFAAFCLSLRNEKYGQSERYACERSARDGAHRRSLVSDNLRPIWFFLLPITLPPPCCSHLLCSIRKNQLLLALAVPPRAATYRISHPLLAALLFAFYQFISSLCFLDCAGHCSGS